MNELGNTPADKGYKPSGVSRAEEAALKAYPPLSVASVCLDGTVPVDLNTGARKRFVEGYEQAEKDLALTWEDMQFIWQIFDILHEECMVYQPDWMFSSKSFYTEALKRFKEMRHEK